MKGKRRNDNLYRYIAYRHLCSLFETRRLFFSHPTVWQKDDPYETILTHEAACRVFALCWCRDSYSDAMWRIYGKDHTYVRIGTTVDRLERELSAARARDDVLYLIGRVRYPRTMESYRNQIEAAERKFKEKPSPRNAVQPLFLKRKAYRHELETRVLIHVNPQRPLDAGATGFFVDVDPHKLIRSILLHPRASDDVVAEQEKYIRDNLRFTNSVRRSLIYTNPDCEPE